MNGSCWQVLELDEGSDVRAIKRRYAQLLKVTRPDDDPAAFERLRSAYERALVYAQNGHGNQPPRETAELFPSPPEPALVEAAPALASQEAWLRDVFADLTLEQLPATLAAARERDCQALFELRLMEQCLQAEPRSAGFMAWGLENLQWLTPWQLSSIPAERTEQLADHLLCEHIQHFAQALASGEKAQALHGIRALLASPWLQSVDRNAWAKQALVEWLAGDVNRSQAFIEQFCETLALGADDSWLEQNWAWQELRSHRKDLQLLNRLRELLALKWPNTDEARAAWMLLKDLRPTAVRWLADTLDYNSWLACDALGAQLRDRYPQLVPQLCRNGVRNWRTWQARPTTDWTYLWVLALVVFTVLLPTLVDVIVAGEISAYARRTWGGLLAVSAAFTLVFCWGGHQLQSWLAILTTQDVWLSTRLLPRTIAKEGAGFLVLRHGLPCLVLGAVCAVWTHAFGVYAVAYGVAVSVAAVAYAIVNLRKERGTQPSVWLRLRDRWL